MKTTEELNALKNEVETMKAKLAELTEDKLAQVSGAGNHEFEFGEDHLLHISERTTEHEKQARLPAWDLIF